MDSLVSKVKIWVFSPGNDTIAVRSETILCGYDISRLLKYGSFATTELATDFVMFSTIPETRVSNGLTVGLRNPCAGKFVKAVRKLEPYTWDFPLEDEVRGIFIIAQHNGDFVADFQTGSIDTPLPLVSIKSDITPKVLVNRMKVIADRRKEEDDFFNKPRDLVETKIASDCVCCLDECFTLSSCGHPICKKCVDEVRLKCPICRSSLARCFPSGSYGEVENLTLFGSNCYSITMDKSAKK